jgi:hypothetical protein
MKRIQCKLKSARGVTLAETLISVLLLTIVLTAVVGGSQMLLRVYHNVRIKADAQTLMSTAMLAITDDLYTAKDWDTADASVTSNAGADLDHTDSFMCEKQHGRIYYENAVEPDTGKHTILRKGSINNQLVTDKTQSLDLNLELTGFTCKRDPEYGSLIFTVGIEVFSGSEENKTILEQQEFTVRSMVVAIETESDEEHEKETVHTSNP